MTMLSISIIEIMNYPQLRKEYGARITAKFPPRRLLSLTTVQIEERREQLEKFLQNVCQDSQVACSSLFTCFLLNCQKVKLTRQAMNR